MTKIFVETKVLHVEPLKLSADYRFLLPNGSLAPTEYPVIRDKPNYQPNLRVPVMETDDGRLWDVMDVEWSGYKNCYAHDIIPIVYYNGKDVGCVLQKQLLLDDDELAPEALEEVMSFLRDKNLVD